ncbi:hypothetical protein ACH4ZX_29325, partial [Streptomyces sp. NPDC020490]
RSLRQALSSQVRRHFRFAAHDPDTPPSETRRLTHVPDVKVMVNLSPASPPVMFRVAMSVLGSGIDADAVSAAVAQAAEEVHGFAPGFAVKACTVADDRVFVAVEVAAAGDRIPRHVGNLDIINSAAVLVAEQCAVNGAPTATMGVS